MTEPTKISEAAIIRGIGENIRTNPAFAAHVFRTIWDAQQPIEKYTHEYAGSDGGRGFQEHETRKWNRFHDRMEDQGWRMTPAEMQTLQEGMYKYRTQFRRLTKPPKREEKSA